MCHDIVAVIFLQTVRSFFVNDLTSILDIVLRNACSCIDKQFALVDVTSGSMTG